MNYLITGAARGIGRGLTRHCLEKGHRVFLLDSNAIELENTLSKAISWAQMPNAFQGQIVDLRDRQAIKDAVRQVHDFCGGHLDVLINNAMPTPHVWDGGLSMLEGTDEDLMRQWDDKIAVGLSAPFWLSRLCKGMLLDNAHNPGCIINIASTRAYQAESNHEAYSAVKGGVLSLTRSMAISLGQMLNLRVNAIIPGWIHVENECKEADEAGAKWDAGLREEDHHWHPAGRVGSVEDVARAMDYLVESQFITGEELTVDGGVSKKMVYPE
jgi:NAD(P)-dependent dehydrogenase (short-subunit alcohol dehydrogenase family)